MFHCHYLNWDQLLFSFSPSLLLNLCKDLKLLKKAFIIISTGTNQHVFFASKLISLYSHFTYLNSATSLFNNLQKEPDTVTWNLIIKSHLDFGLLVKLCCCVRLGELGVKVDSLTLPSINRGVSSLKRDSLLGKMVRCVAMKLGFGFDLYFCNKSWWVCYGLKVFDEMSQRDLVSWTSMISGFVFEGSFVGAWSFQ